MGAVTKSRPFPLRRWPYTEHIVAALVVAVLTAILVRQVMREEPALWDEPAWISAGVLTYDLVRDLAPPSRWEVAYNEQELGTWGNLNPPVGKLWVGWFSEFGRRDEEPVRYRWKFFESLEFNRAAGNLPPPRIVTAARIGIVCSAALLLWMVYLCARQLTERRWLPLLAPLSLASFGVFNWHAAHVYTDIPQVALLMAGVSAYLAYLRRGRRAFFLLALVLMGLSCSVKFSSGSIVLVTVAFTAFFLKGPLLNRAQLALTACAVPFAVFVAVNPFLYPSPARALALVSAWSETRAAQMRRPELREVAVKSVPQRLWLTAQRSFVYPVLAGPPKPVVRGAVTEGLLVLFCVGLLTLMQRSRRIDARMREPDLVSRFYLTSLVMFVGATAAWLPFDWGRYYLPILALLPAVYVVGAAELPGLLRRPQATGQSREILPESTT